MDKTKTEQHNAKDAEAMATLQARTSELEEAGVIAEQQNVTLKARASELEEARVIAEQQNVTLKVRTSELEEARATLEAKAHEIDIARKSENAGHTTHRHIARDAVN